VDPRPPEDGIVGGLNIENTKLCDDVEKVPANWELNRARETSFTPIKTLEK